MNLQTQRNPETSSGQLKGRRPASSLVGSGEGIRLQDPKTITVESPVIGHKQRSHSVATPRNPVIQPRMSQLETLEAKVHFLAQCINKRFTWQGNRF